MRRGLLSATSATKVIETMTDKYSDYGNLTTLEFSAAAAFPAA